jgi:hypothetical protein
MTDLCISSAKCGVSSPDPHSETLTSPLSSLNWVWDRRLSAIEFEDFDRSANSAGCLWLGKAKERLNCPSARSHGHKWGECANRVGICSNLGGLPSRRKISLFGKNFQMLPLLFIGRWRGQMMSQKNFVLAPSTCGKVFHSAKNKPQAISFGFWGQLRAEFGEAEFCYSSTSICRTRA